MTSTTWTDERGVTHAMAELSDTQKDLLYKPIVEARKRALAEQARIQELLNSEGLNIKPVDIEEPWSPEFVSACAPFTWASREHLDEPPRPITCLDCLAST